MHLKPTHIALAAVFTTLLTLTFYVLTNSDIPPKPLPQTYVNGPVNITGYLRQMHFPARVFVSEEAAHGRPLYEYGDYMAVVANETSTPFFLFSSERNGTIWENYGLWPPSFELDLGGLSNWDIYGAYTSQLRITVTGNAFTVNRLNRTFQCIAPDLIIIHDRMYLPFFVTWWQLYGEVLISNGGLYGLGANFETHNIYVPPSDYLNSTSFYRVSLVAGDSIRFSAESPQPFSMKVYASVGGRPSVYDRSLGSVIYSVENVTSITEEFNVDEAGEYSFSFYTDYRMSEQFTVDFSAGRLD